MINYNTYSTLICFKLNILKVNKTCFKFLRYSQFCKQKSQLFDYL